MAATPQDYIANWIGGISSNERIGYIKRLIDTCPLEDIKPLKNVLVNTAKRKSPFPRNYAKKIRLGQINVEASTSSTPNEVVPKSSPEVLVSTYVGMDVSNQLQAEQFWWKSYKKEDIVALDCEIVSIKMPQGQRNKMTAATVSVVDFYGKEIYCVCHVKNLQGVALLDYKFF